jgi:hypothetical protein
MVWRTIEKELQATPHKAKLRFLERLNADIFAKERKPRMGRNGNGAVH